MSQLCSIYTQYTCAIHVENTLIDARNLHTSLFLYGSPLRGLVIHYNSPALTGVEVPIKLALVRGLELEGWNVWSTLYFCTTNIFSKQAYPPSPTFRGAPILFHASDTRWQPRRMAKRLTPGDKDGDTKLNVCTEYMQSNKRHNLFYCTRLVSSALLQSHIFTFAHALSRSLSLFLFQLVAVIFYLK